MISLQKVLCLVMVLILVAQQTAEAQAQVGNGTSDQTLFAYRTSLRGRLQDALTGESVFPFDVPLALTPVDPNEFAHATTNSKVAFRITYGLTEGQVVYASTGTVVEADVTRIRKGQLRIRHGRMEPRVMEIAVGGLTNPAPVQKNLRLRLVSSLRSRSRRKMTQLITSPLTAIRMTIVLPVEYVALITMCSFYGGCEI